MAYELTPPENDALRARIKETLAAGPQRGSPKRAALNEAFAGNLWRFMQGGRGTSPAVAARVAAIIDGKAAPAAPAATATKGKAKGRVWQYVPAAEGKALKAAILKRAGANRGGLAAFFTETMGLTPGRLAHMYKFVRDDGPVTVQMAARIRDALDGKPAPKAPRDPRRAGGRIIERISASESKALRAAVLKQVGPGPHQHRSLGAFFLATMGLPAPSQSGIYTVIKGTDPITVEMAQRLRDALAGRPAPVHKARTRKASEAPPAIEQPGTELAPPNVLASLRLDTGHVLASRFGGDVPALARELGITAARLSRFVNGGSLRLTESADVANRLAMIAPAHHDVAAAPSSALTMVRALSVQAWMPAHRPTEPASAEPAEVRARKLLAKWHAEAFEMIVQLAGGAA